MLRRIRDHTKADAHGGAVCTERRAEALPRKGNLAAEHQITRAEGTEDRLQSVQKILSEGLPDRIIERLRLIEFKGRTLFSEHPAAQGADAAVGEKIVEDGFTVGQGIDPSVLRDALCGIRAQFSVKEKGGAGPGTETHSQGAVRRGKRGTRAERIGGDIIDFCIQT